MTRLTPRVAVCLVFMISGVAPSGLRAQCPDGSPPPCAVQRTASREPSRPPDPNRIAILPFRVTTTDTLLGEGFAELLATEFTGEGAPRAVDMATVLNAWRRAGGGLRTPLPRAKAIQVARELGAGLVSEGSIVGLGRQITVTASLVTVPDGSPRGAAARVTAPVDSLDAALRQAAASLLGSVGARKKTDEGVRYTDSPEAMRAYLIAMSAWRRGRLDTAITMFDRAIALDSMFAQAVYRRYVAELWGLVGRRSLAQLAWDRRQRLSSADRLVLEGVLGPNHPKARTLAERLADRERTALQLPDSPDAQYFAGDLLYHYGDGSDPIARLQRARDYFTRSVALDSQAVALRHLVEVGVRLRDTAMLRSVTPVYLRTEDIGRWGGAWIAWASSGDNARLAELRRRVFTEEYFNALWPVGTAMMAKAPASLFDEMFSLLLDSLPPSSRQRPILRLFWGIALTGQGRPEAAEEVWARLSSDQTRDADRYQIGLALVEASEGLDVDGSVRRLSQRRADDTSRAATSDRCLLALWRARRGDTVTTERASYRGAESNCAVLLDLQRGSKQGEARRAQLDSATTAIRSGSGDNGFDLYLLARAWEEAGEPRRGLDVIRRRQMSLGMGEAPWTLPYEGRLTAQVGDTVGALRVYQYYLSITSSAEPVLEAKRQGVRAEIARLSGGGRSSR